MYVAFYTVLREQWSSISGMGDGPILKPLHCQKWVSCGDCPAYIEPIPKCFLRTDSELKLGWRHGRSCPIIKDTRTGSSSSHLGSFVLNSLESRDFFLVFINSFMRPNSHYHTIPPSKVYSSKFFSTFTELYNHHRNLELSVTPQKNPLDPLAVTHVSFLHGPSNSPT